MTLPAETTWTDLEREFAENEPPYLFPQNQDSYWGQVRRVITDPLQAIADLLAQYYLNMSVDTVVEDDMQEWEEQLGIPGAAAGRTVEQRRAFLRSRFVFGAFTRTRRANLVEAFITATFGPPVELVVGGVPFDALGIPLFGETVVLPGSYNIVENVSAFTYDVRILNTITIDQPGLIRELKRITPDGITFTLTMTATP